MLTKKRYQALHAIHSCVPGEPGNEAMVQDYYSPYVSFPYGLGMRQSLIALIIPVQSSCCECPAFWSQPSSDYICLKRFTLWSWGKDSANKKHLANIQHSQAQILADLVLWPHFITNTCSVYCTLQIGCHRETDSFTRSINHHWDFINQPQDEDYLFPCGQLTPGSVVLRRQQFSRNYHYHQGFLPTMRVHNMPYN